MKTSKFMRCLGEEYVQLCLQEYGRSLSMMGSNMVEFLSNLDGFHEQIIQSSKFAGQTPPSFRCEKTEKTEIIHFHSDKTKFLEFYAGIVKGITKYMYYVDIAITAEESESAKSLHQKFHINASESKSNNSCKNHCDICIHEEPFSTNPSDSMIGVETFCETFPFHVIVDRQLQITQLGVALLRLIAPLMSKQGDTFSTFFQIVRPKLEPITFNKLLSRVNFSFLLETSLSKSGKASSQVSRNTYMF